MKRAVIITLAMASLLSVAAPAMAATAYPIGTVNIRSGPGTQYALLGALNEGQSASVVGHEGQWLKVQTGSGTVGYMADWFTREVFDDAATYLTVDTDVLNIRTEPDLGAPVIGQVVQGDRLRLVEGLAGWYKVSLGSAGTGWVKAEYTYKSAPVPATAPPNTAPPEQPPVAPPRAGLGKQVLVSSATAMYVGRNTEYDVVAYPRLWERLTYLDSMEGWVKVQNAAGTRGWIDGRKVQVIDAALDWSLQAQYHVEEGSWSAQFLRVREIVPGAYDLALRSGSSADYGVIARLQSGQRIKLLTVTAGEYVRVMLPDGTAGWISRNYLKPVPGTPSQEEAVSLKQTGPGVLRLEVKGATGDVKASADTLTVGLPQNANRSAALAVGEFGVGEFSLDAQGLVVRFTQAFRQQVVERTADHLVLELRPVVESVTSTEVANGLTYRFGIAGSLAPSAHREGGDVVLTLPGARLGEGATAPAGVRWTADASGVTVRVASGRSYAIKRGDGYVDLVLYSPGLSGKTIVVDPGHGGSETGAIGYSGLVEKTVNLAISLKLQALLEQAGAKVIMTRTTDTRCSTPAQLSGLSGAEQLRVDLNCRTVVPNTAGADLFLSVHSNASPASSAHGTESYWSSENLNNPQSRYFAGLVQDEMVKALGTPDRGIGDEIFYVVTFTDAPAVLAEVGYLSNPGDEAMLKQDAVRQQTAEALMRAMQRFFAGQ